MKRKNRKRLAKEAEIARREAKGDFRHLKVCLSVRIGVVTLHTLTAVAERRTREQANSKLLLCLSRHCPKLGSQRTICTVTPGPCEHRRRHDFSNIPRRLRRDLGVKEEVRVAAAAVVAHHSCHATSTLSTTRNQTRCTKGTPILSPRSMASPTAELRWDSQIQIRI
jgi:hypothetical protein